MAYQALYRKWRPLTFDDVVGQEHITRTLKNEIVNGKLAHAYLFCGTRGTGKTSTAKILARAVNCLNPRDGNPCNECEVCRGILDESILDVVELDGASRNKVENIRDIIDDVMFLPSVARKKVYIIDEVHMVTTQAFNALLKTLEEPPPHVLFILATTELNKVPATVLSRCQRFDFRRITNADIVARLKTILAGDGRKVTDEALALVAELGDGSMRDSLSILDQCLGYREEEITYDDIVSIIGIADDSALFRLAEAMADCNGAAALSILDEVLLAGKEIGVFMESVIGFLRDMLIVKLMSAPERILNVSEEKLEKMKALAPKLTREKLIHALTVLNEAVASARLSGFSRTVYELAVVKLCDPMVENSYEALLDRMADLEKQLAEGVRIAQISAADTAQQPLQPQQEQSLAGDEIPPWEELPPLPEEPPPENASAMEVAMSPNGEIPMAESTAAKPPETARQKDGAPQTERQESHTAEPAALGAEIPARWEEIISYVKMNGGMPIFSHLKKAGVKILHGRLGLIFGDAEGMSRRVVEKPSNLELVEKAVEAVTGEHIAVSCFSQKEVGGEEPKEDPLARLEELAKTHDEIEII